MDLSGLHNYMKNAEDKFHNITKERKELLEEFGSIVAKTLKEKQSINLTFICTHNSRRSHMSQLWAQAAAEYYGIEGVSTYSGGTEATAFNPRAVKALKKAGFEISAKDDTKNPKYEVVYAESKKSIIAFSKKYADEYNPQKGFIAVMTCGHADENCPVVFGCDDRIAITYDDPKAFDNTDLEEAKYDERCLQISSEMLYAFSHVKNMLKD